MAGTVTETGERVVPGSTVTLRAGDTLALEPATGARGYLAVPGGIDVPVVLGSRSTALGAGFGGLDGRALRAGDRLAPAEDRTIPHAHWPGVPAPVTVSATNPLRVLAGPHAADLGAGCARRVPRDGPGPSARRATAWGCASTATRSPAPRPRSSSSHGVVAGTIQLPPDRRPIVLLVDHQPTGGYPVLAVVITRRPRPPRPARAGCARVVRAIDTRRGSSGTPRAGRRLRRGPRPAPRRRSLGRPVAGRRRLTPARDPSPASPADRSCKGPAMARSAGRGQTCAR